MGTTYDREKKEMAYCPQVPQNGIMRIELLSLQVCRFSCSYKLLFIFLKMLWQSFDSMFSFLSLEVQPTCKVGAQRNKLHVFLLLRTLPCLSKPPW
jgi:hypothetical protein